MYIIIHTPGFSHWDEYGARFGMPQSYEQYIILMNALLFFGFFLGLARAHPNLVTNMLNSTRKPIRNTG